MNMAIKRNGYSTYFPKRMPICLILFMLFILKVIPYTSVDIHGYTFQGLFVSIRMSFIPVFFYIKILPLFMLPCNIFHTKGSFLNCVIPLPILQQRILINLFLLLLKRVRKVYFMGPWRLEKQGFLVAWHIPTVTTSHVVP